MGNNRRYLGTAFVCIYMLMELRIQINAIEDKEIQIPNSISQMSIPKWHIEKSTTRYYCAGPSARMHLDFSISASELLGVAEHI